MVHLTPAKPVHFWTGANNISWFDLTGDGIVNQADFDGLEIIREDIGAGYIEPIGLAKDHYHMDWR